MTIPLTVYKASAGSGKTFTLATEYIRLVVENPQCYRNILAVTFTNKATEEMKMRILSQLYGIWKQLPDSADYTKAICEKSGLTPAFVSQRSGIALSNLLHNYSYFRVETIDTFFQSVLRNLARELELTANLRIELNDTQVEELAVDHLIEDLSKTDKLLQWILQYIMENIQEDKSWNVIGQIKQFGYTIFRDQYKSVNRQLNEKIQEKGFFERFTAQLRALRDTARVEMQQLADDFFAILQREALGIEDFSYKASGVCSIFIKLRDGVFDDSILSKRVTDAADDDEKWCAKSHPRREFILSLIQRELSPLLNRAITQQPIQWRQYQSATLTLRHLNQLRLLSSIEQKVRILNEEANRFLLSDTQQLLHSLIEGSDSPFIFEKIGARLEHVMIDEFQDTSTVQWHNFKVLLAEAMSHEGSRNLIVGDVKQSIYRWRSGDWRLLNDIGREFPHPDRQLKIESLDTNYRSRRNIITFNNTFFQKAAQLEYLALGQTEAATQLLRAYADVEQHYPSGRQQEGRVSVQLLPSSTDFNERMMQAIDDAVGELMAMGVRVSDIAILVRVNKLIPRIAEYFADHRPEVTLVSDEAFRLDASQAVALIIEALRLLTRPNDILAKAQVVKLYHKYILEDRLTDDALLLHSASLDTLLPEAFAARQSDLRKMPLYELCEYLYRLFGLQRLHDQNAYICAFFDLVADFVNTNTTDIDAFIKEWDETFYKKTIQSDEQNGIRLISIHKSKGLEFKHVIIPFCDWQLEKQKDNIIWCQPEEAPYSELPLIPVDYSQKSMRGTVFEEHYRQEHLQNVVDNLNLLYVAFTRACNNLYVFGRRGAKNSRSTLLEQALPEVVRDLPGSLLEGTDNEQQPLSFTYGTFYTGNPKEKESHTDNVFLQPVLPYRMQIESFENRTEFRQSNKSQAFTAIESDDADQLRRQEYIQTGNVLHRLFSTIRTTADIDSALLQLQLDGVLYDSQLSQDRLMTMIRKRLESPQVADWFAPRWTLFNECTILSVEDGKVCAHRPDRVMTDGSEWVVVDFKFGSQKPEYISQVQEYMSLIKSMNPQALVKGYLWFVYTNKIVAV
ncbi:MAG: UvrD-helicase domain-containing protein [Prevotella sp.]|nr:UvrD-helicase domain-containing protein [Prevotella sp.]